jgi:hypothetical protein
MGTLHTRSGKICRHNIGLGKPTPWGVIKIGSEEPRLLKFRAYQIGFSKIGFAEIDFKEIEDTEINFS